VALRTCACLGVQAPGILSARRAAHPRPALRVLVQLAAPTKAVGMPPPLTFNPPISIDLCETAGQESGHARIGVERVVFEQELEARLLALHEALRAADIDRDQALAVFDTAAWGTWEVPKAPPEPEATFQEQSRPLGS
jgi:hypothetical protein